MPQPTLQQRHTESSILESYLLPPSSLPTILPYESFLQLAPTQHRSHPYLKRLYRDLQFQRNIDVDAVRQNIEREVNRSIVLKSQLARRVNEELAVANRQTSNATKSRKRKRGSNANNDAVIATEPSDVSGDNDEFNNPANLTIDSTYLNDSIHTSHGNTASTHPLTSGTRKQHTISTLMTGLDTACSSLESEIADLESESSKILAEMTETVGSLSDLRYGRFARPVSGDSGDGNTVEDEVLEALKGLQGRLEAVLG